MTTGKRPYRLRPIRRKMSFATFEKTIPVRPGWKREYYDGKAHVRPSWTMATFILQLTSRPGKRTTGLRRVTLTDHDGLLDAFIDSFRYAPEYVGYPMVAYRKKAAAFIEGFFGETRGRWSSASHLVCRNGRVLAAALVKEQDGKQPLLDCVYTRPECFRMGLATAATTAAVNKLAALNFKEMLSHAMLANEASLAWHERFGFSEVPEMFVAQARYFCAMYELDRLKKIGALTDADRERLTATVEHWSAEWQRLRDLPPARRTDLPEV